MRVLIFGDSITQGFWDVDGGWVARLRREYDSQRLEDSKQDSPFIFNLGVSGDSSIDILKRFENEYGVRLEGTNKSIVIFAFGVNDSRIKGDQNYTDEISFQHNLENLLNIARKYTSNIIFVGVTPCVESRTNPTAWNDTRYLIDRVKAFDKVLKEFCSIHNVSYIEIMTKFEAEQEKQELLPDGLHPNAAGHQLLAELIKPNLDQLLKDSA